MNLESGKRVPARKGMRGVFSPEKLTTSTTRVKYCLEVFVSDYFQATAVFRLHGSVHSMEASIIHSTDQRIYASAQRS